MGSDRLCNVPGDLLPQVSAKVLKTILRLEIFIVMHSSDISSCLTFLNESFSMPDLGKTSGACEERTRNREVGSALCLLELQDHLFRRQRIEVGKKRKRMVPRKERFWCQPLDIYGFSALCPFGTAAGGGVQGMQGLWAV